VGGGAPRRAHRRQRRWCRGRGGGAIAPLINDEKQMCRYSAAGEYRWWLGPSSKVTGEMRSAISRRPPPLPPPPPPPGPTVAGILSAYHTSPSFAIILQSHTPPRILHGIVCPGPDHPARRGASRGILRGRAARGPPAVPRRPRPRRRQPRPHRGVELPGVARVHLGFGHIVGS
jgi:hypothetical protein